jgi:hypothetical protein
MSQTWLASFLWKVLLTSATAPDSFKASLSISSPCKLLFPVSLRPHSLTHTMFEVALAKSASDLVPTGNATLTRVLFED